MLMLNKYNRFYKSCLLDYGLVYANLINSNFVYSKDLGNYINNSLQILKSEYDNKIYVYKETNDVDLFKINIYLLGLELKGFLSYLLSFNTDLLNKNELKYVNFLCLNLNTLINRIHKKMLKWNV